MRRARGTSVGFVVRGLGGTLIAWGTLGAFVCASAHAQRHPEPGTGPTALHCLRGEAPAAGSDEEEAFLRGEGARLGEHRPPRCVPILEHGYTAVLEEISEEHRGSWWATRGPDGEVLLFDMRIETIWITSMFDEEITEDVHWERAFVRQVDTNDWSVRASLATGGVRAPENGHDGAYNWYAFINASGLPVLYWISSNVVNCTDCGTVSPTRVGNERFWRVPVRSRTDGGLVQLARTTGWSTRPDPENAAHTRACISRGTSSRLGCESAVLGSRPEWARPQSFACRLFLEGDPDDHDSRAALRARPSPSAEVISRLDWEDMAPGRVSLSRRVRGGFAEVTAPARGWIPANQVRLACY